MSNDAGEAMARGAAPVRRGAVAFIFVTILLDMLALGVIMPILPKLIESFVDNDTAHAARIFGLFGTAWALMQFVFSPVLGALSDRFGRRPVVLLSNFGLAADYVLMALAPSLVWLFIGRVISGITSPASRRRLPILPTLRRRSGARRSSAGLARPSAPASSWARRSAACSATSIRACRSGRRRL
ncbi:MFS family permease [Bradyrhizobium japonicum]|nr:MFS family permease [Bradyrhizobium japonicum]